MVKICSPRAGYRKGVVEKVNHTAAQRWWRTLADDMSMEEARVERDRLQLSVRHPAPAQPPCRPQGDCGHGRGP